eukprot:GHVR01024760.1.p1 GENE.GHVR01024760.1~~GHVR01024760.1.p1  ORF type:complete len:245 (+),score=55.01 GHVR01024760.1:79-813(+)
MAVNYRFSHEGLDKQDIIPLHEMQDAIRAIDLKHEIAHKRKLAPYGRQYTFLLTDHKTGKEYNDDQLVYKFGTVIVQRIAAIENIIMPSVVDNQSATDHLSKRMKTNDDDIRNKSTYIGDGIVSEYVSCGGYSSERDDHVPSSHVDAGVSPLLFPDCFLCPLCKCPFDDPVVLNCSNRCGLSACRLCVDGALSTNPSGCPTCDVGTSVAFIDNIALKLLIAQIDLKFFYGVTNKHTHTHTHTTY